MKGHERGWNIFYLAKGLCGVTARRVQRVLVSKDTCMILVTV